MRESNVSIISPNLPGKFWTDLIRAREGHGNLPYKGAADLFGLTKPEFKAVRQGTAKITGTYGDGYYLAPERSVEPRALTRGICAPGHPCDDCEAEGLDGGEKDHGEG